MAKRNSFLDFVQNFNAGYDTVGRVAQDYQLAKIGTAQPQQSQGFTAADGEQLANIANAKDADGKPLYNLTANSDGSYTVADAANPSNSGTIAQHGVTDFLGQRSAGTMTPDQVETARGLASAGVIGQSDPAAAIRMRREIIGGQREDQRFAWDQARNERDLRQGAQQEADTNALRDIDQQNADFFKARLKQADGSQRAANVDDHMAAMQHKVGLLIDGGYSQQAEAALKDLTAQQAVQIQLQGAQRKQALGVTAARLQAGDLGAVKDFYNTYIPDGAHVTDVSRDPKTGQITIQRQSWDGTPLKATTMRNANELVAAMSSIEDPMALFNYSNNELRNNLALRADSRAGAAEGRAATEFKAGDAQRQLGTTVASLQLALANAQTEPERQAIREKLLAVQGSVAGKGTPPAGYRWKGDGTLEAIPGGPGDSKPMPEAATKALLDDQSTLRRAQAALALIQGGTVDGVKGDANATGGIKSVLPNRALNAVDPGGVSTRAAIGNLGSMVIHDRSGAATSVSEMENLKPFVPLASDSPEQVQKKLVQFVQAYDAMLKDNVNFHRASGYKVPDNVLKQLEVTLPVAAAPAQQAGTPASGPAPFALPDGWSVKVH